MKAVVIQLVVAVRFFAHFLILTPHAVYMNVTEMV